MQLIKLHSCIILKRLKILLQLVNLCVKTFEQGFRDSENCVEPMLCPYPFSHITNANALRINLRKTQCFESNIAIV